MLKKLKKINKSKINKVINKLMNVGLRVIGVYGLILTILILLGYANLNLSILGQVAYSLVITLIGLFGEFKLED